MPQTVIFVTVLPLDSVAFLCDDVWKLRITLEMQSAAGRGFAVTLKESDRISYRDETVVVKQCEGIV